MRPRNPGRNVKLILFPRQDLEDKLQSKRQALEKWRELQSWSRGCTAQLEHLRYQLESSQPLDQLETEVGKLQGELEEWGNTARGTDLLCEQSGTQLTGQSARSTVHELTGKLETLRSVLLVLSAFKKQFLVVVFYINRGVYSNFKFF